MEFGEKLQRLRKDKSMSQEQLAEHLNVSRQAVSRWEKNVVLPDVCNVIAISELFDVSIDYLLKSESVYKKEICCSNYNEERKFLKEKLRIFVGISFSIFGSLSILILFILSSIKEKYIVGGPEFRGIRGFLLINRLQWFMTLSILMIPLGILIIFYPKIKAYSKK